MDDFINHHVMGLRKFSQITLGDFIQNERNGKGMCWQTVIGTVM